MQMRFKLQTPGPALLALGVLSQIAPSQAAVLEEVVVTAQKRKTKTLLWFFRWLGKERTGDLRFICSDMWKPYLKVIAKKAGHAIHVLNRFHIMATLRVVSN